MSADSDIPDVVSPEPQLLYYSGGEDEEGAELQLDGNPKSTASPWGVTGVQHWYSSLRSAYF